MTYAYLLLAVLPLSGCLYVDVTVDCDSIQCTDILEFLEEPYSMSGEFIIPDSQALTVYDPDIDAGM